MTATQQPADPTALTPQDRWQISDVLARYCLALDGKDFAALDEVFAPDATADFGDVGGPAGRDAIRDLLATALARFDVTQHQLGTSLVTGGGDTAQARTYLIAQHVREGAPGGDRFTVGGTYHDDLVRTAAGWRIQHRRLEFTWSGGNPEIFVVPSGG